MTRGLPTRFFSLRWRLPVALSGLVLICTALCILGAFLFLRATLTDRARSDLSRTLSGAAGYVDNQRSDLLGTANLIANDSKVVESTGYGDREGLIVYLTRYYANLNADVLDVIDDQGKTLVRMESTLSWGDDSRRLAGVRAALEGHDSVMPETDLPGREEAGGYALRATVPIRSHGIVIGAVVVGRQLGSAFADRIGHAASADVNLIAGNQRTGTTLKDSTGLPLTGVPEPESVLRRIPLGRTTIDTVDENGQQVLSGLVPLQGANGTWVGAVEVIHPLEPLYDLIRQLLLLLLGLGALVVVFGTVLALSISRRLTSRLLALESSASQVAELAHTDAALGQLHSALVVQGNDEIASLGRSLAAMMTALDERLIANAELYSAAQARVRDLSGLAEIARLLTAVSSLRETMDTLGERVCRLVGCPAVAIWLPGEGPVPSLYGGHGLPEGYEKMSETVLSRLSPDEEISVQTALRTGEIVHRPLDGPAPIDSSDVRHDVRDMLHSMGWSSSTTVPLLVQGRVVGALTCYSQSPDPLPDSDLSLLATIADQVAIVVENARLATEALRERDEQYRAVFEATSDGLVIMDLDGHFLEVNPAMCRMHGYAREELLTKRPLDILEASHHEIVKRFTETLQDAEKSYHAQTLNVRKDGSVFPVEVQGVPLMYGGERQILAVVRDITERVRAQELLEQRVQERTRELSTLLQVSHNVASTIELHPLLELILDELKLVAEYDGAAVLLKEGDRMNVLARRLPSGLPMTGPPYYSLDQMRPWLDCMRAGRALVIEDIRADSPHARAYRDSVGEYLHTSFSFERSLIAVPLMHKDRMIGALVLTSSELAFFNSRHEVLATAIASQAAVAIENARLYERALEVAALEERQRLARELHDSVSQALYGIALGAKTARTLLDRSPERVAEPLDYVLAQAAAGLAEMRALIFELRPEALETEGLVAALEKQVDFTRARHGLQVTATLCAEPDVPFAMKEAMYRIAQEALHNTVKHARATAVEISLLCIHGGLVLEVEDDGRGFDPHGDFPGHLGMKTMRERATQQHGTLDVESVAGQGTRVRVWIPMEAPVSQVS